MPLLLVHPCQQVGEQPVQHIERIILRVGFQRPGERDQRRHPALCRHALDPLRTGGACIPRQHFEPTRGDIRQVEIVDTEFTRIPESL